MIALLRNFTLALLLGCAVPAQAQRIVTLAPFLTELVFAAGAGDKLVGVAAHSDFPLAARGLPVVADAAGAHREALLALRPDIVLGWRTGTPLAAIEGLRQAGVNVIVMDGARLDDVPRLLREIGTMAGAATLAETEARRFEAEIGALRTQFANRPLVRAMFEIWHAPLMTISGQHFMTDALTACGGRNVFADLPGVAPEISYESVIERNPDVIIGAGSARDEAAFRANWMRFSSLKAVKTGALIHVNPDTIQRQTPRLLEGVRAICAGLERVRSVASK